MDGIIFNFFISANMIKDKKIYRAYSLADKLANSRAIKNSFFNIIKRLIFRDPVMDFLKRLRKTEYLKNCKKGIFWKIIYFYNLYKFYKISRKLGFSIPLNVFGPGLSLPHYGTIVVNPAAKVGKNCRLHVCVNIGATTGSIIAPIIGDNVYIGPGAILFGDIIVADNVTIAANATVNKSFEPSNVTIGGTPAKILNDGTPKWWETIKLNL